MQNFAHDFQINEILQITAAITIRTTTAPQNHVYIYIFLFAISPNPLFHILHNTHPTRTHKHFFKMNAHKSFHSFEIQMAHSAKYFYLFSNQTFEHETSSALPHPRGHHPNIHFFPIMVAHPFFIPMLSFLDIFSKYYVIWVQTRIFQALIHLV